MSLCLSTSELLGVFIHHRQNRSPQYFFLKGAASQYLISAFTFGFLGRYTKQELSTSNKILIYKAILKPIRTYAIQLWGTASTSNIEILERSQSKVLRVIVDVPWYVPNTVIRSDLQTSTIKEEIRRHSSQYSAYLSVHPNDLVVNLMGQHDNRRLRRHLPNDLPTRF
jgi:hypothetical protein